LRGEGGIVYAIVEIGFGPGRLQALATSGYCRVFSAPGYGDVS
jgi:hypothetical protein